MIKSSRTFDSFFRWKTRQSFLLKNQSFSLFKNHALKSDKKFVKLKECKQTFTNFSGFFAGLPVDLTTKKPIEAGLARILRRHNTLNDKHSATKQLDLSDEHQRRPKEYKKECCSATFTLQLTSLPSASSDVGSGPMHN